MTRQREGGRPLAILFTFAIGLVGCTSSGLPADRDPGTAEGTVRLYTSVTQDTVDAVLDVLREHHPGLVVEVFRAPTGELDARIAAERRSGGIAADVLWATDPLSMQAYEADGLLASLDGVQSAVPATYRTERSIGTRLLNLVIVTREDLDPAPRGWSDLADPVYAHAVALPDPGFAGSAFAALGYFASAPDFGLDYYQQLRTNGAVQLSAIGDVITGVAEGRYAAGIALDKSVRDAMERGSPIRLVWPEPGAIVLFSPVAVFAHSSESAASRAFVEFLVSQEAQAAIAATGWQPVDPTVPWPHEGPVVSVEWSEIFGRQQELLAQYRAIFGD